MSASNSSNNVSDNNKLARQIIYPIATLILCVFTGFIMFALSIAPLTKFIFIVILCIFSYASLGFTDGFVNNDCDSSKMSSTITILTTVSTSLFIGMMVIFLFYIGYCLSKHKMKNPLKNPYIIGAFITVLALVIAIGFIVRTQTYDENDTKCASNVIKYWLMISNFTNALLFVFLFMLGIIMFLDPDASGRTQDNVASGYFNTRLDENRPDQIAFRSVE